MTEIEMKIIHEEMHDILEPLYRFEIFQLEVSAVQGNNWIAYPAILLYCLGVQQRKDLPCENDGLAE